MAILTTLMTTPLLHWIQEPAPEAHPSALPSWQPAGVPAPTATDVAARRDPALH